MTTIVNSVIVRDGRAYARARATARQARIAIEIWFDAETGWSKADLWQQARDQVLRYLDPD